MALSDDEQFAIYGEELAAAIEAALPGWVAAAVDRRLSTVAVTPAVDRDQLQHKIVDSGQAAATEIGSQLRDLLRRDVDHQWTNPLSIIRSTVSYPSAILAGLGVPPVARSADAVRMFPDDPYDLTPANFAEFGPEVHECGIRWGAAKAHLHLKRHKKPDSRRSDESR